MEGTDDLKIYYALNVVGLWESSTYTVEENYSIHFNIIYILFNNCIDILFALYCNGIYNTICIYILHRHNTPITLAFSHIR